MNTEDTQQTRVNGELISETDFDLLWAPQLYAGQSASAAAPLYTDYSPAAADTDVLSVAVAPRGKITGTRFYPVEGVARDAYIQARYREAEQTRFSDYAAIGQSRFKHLDRVDTLDWYPSDMRRVLSLFFGHYGTGSLYVVNGFRSVLHFGITAHSTGLAVDIQAETREQADRIMHAAYLTGIPNIIPGGDFATGEGYVHLDIAPKTDLNYGAGSYTGPWD